MPVSVHVHCAACQKMFLEVANGEKEKTHVLGICPKCARADLEHAQAQQRRRQERKEKK